MGSRNGCPQWAWGMGRRDGSGGMGNGDGRRRWVPGARGRPESGSGVSTGVSTPRAAPSELSGPPSPRASPRARATVFQAPRGIPPVWGVAGPTAAGLSVSTPGCLPLGGKTSGPPGDPRDAPATPVSRRISLVFPPASLPAMTWRHFPAALEPTARVRLHGRLHAQPTAAQRDTAISSGVPLCGGSGGSENPSLSSLHEPCLGPRGKTSELGPAHLEAEGPP